MGERLLFLQNALGGVPAPLDCFLTLRGLKTLAVRMERHCDNAERIAALLAASSAVSQVFYPGLEGDAGHAVAGGRCAASAAWSASACTAGAPPPTRR